MGNHVVGSTKIIYTTKDGIPIEYIYYDLKGKNRFPHAPSNQRQIQLMFEKTLREIQIGQQQLSILRQFNAKYKHRFVIMHGRKVEEYKEKHQLHRLRTTKNFDDDSFKSIEETRKKQLDQKLKLLENNETAIKMHLGSIDRAISEKNLYTQFIKIDGIRRLVKILDKAIATNKQKTNTVFQNQIEILKFMKSLSDHNPKQYFAAVGNIRDYAIVLLRAYHPINTAVTAYVLLMLQDYSWKVQNSLSLMQCLKAYQEESRSKSLLQPFVQSIYHTDNILMCCYNLRFINELLISIVDDIEKEQFQQQLRNQRYELLIEDVKNKLQQNFYKIQYCTFIAVGQAIFKEATKNRKEKENIPENLGNRATLNLQTLQQHLLVNFVQGFITNNENVVEEHSQEDEDDNYIQVYLAQNDKKSFNKFILDTFSEIQHYYKYTIIIDEGVQDLTCQDVNEEMQKLKKNGLSVQEYLKRIKGTCLKNNCEQNMLNCFKALQYFQKNDWKKLENFINEGMKTSRNPNQLEQLRKQLEQKEKQMRNIKKDYHQLKADVINRTKLEDGGHNTTQVNKLDMTVVQGKLNNQNVLASINGLPNLPPPPNGIPNLPPPPSGLPILPPPPSVLPNLPPPPIGLPNLPPPPSGLPLLPPPPTGLPILPPPPPTIGLPNLPPPPIGLPNLPPPPSGIPILPPPPSGLPNLPPPPMGLPNLPPPPSGLPILPPPPPGLPNLPPPPIGLPNLPPPPLGMPKVPGLPSLPGLPSMPLGGLGMVQQKKKPKKQPKVNLKACNYIILSYDKIKQTIWQKVDDSKVKLDQNQLQQLFAKAMPKKQESKVAQSAILLPSAPAKKEKVKLLGADKYRNFQIVLTKLKLPEQGITEALTQCSGKYVIPSVLDSISKILPSEEDEMMVNNYDGSLQDLGTPQKFIKEITSIPEYANRVKALIFANNKEQIYFELQNKIQNLTAAFDSLRQNYRLHHALQVALAVGNYLNGTGIKGGAWGFRLDTIQNMQQVTSTDNKMNAAFYLIKQVWKKYTYPIFDKQQLDMYQYVQKMPTNQVKADLAQLKKYITAVQKAFNSKNKNNSNDRIDQHCEDLLLQAKSKYATLEEGVKKMDKAFTSCASFYCEDPNKAASDEIGKKIFKCILFIFNTQKVYYDIEEKRKKQEAKKANKVQMKFNQSNSSKPNPQLNVKLPPKASIGAIKLPMPITPEVNPKEKLKQLEKTQQEKEKKFLQEIMKKRSSKMVAFRQSRMPGNANNTGKPQQQIDFLKGL